MGIRKDDPPNGILSLDSRPGHRMPALAFVELLTKKVTSLNIDLCMNRYSVTLEISGDYVY